MEQGVQAAHLSAPWMGAAAASQRDSRRARAVNDGGKESHGQRR